ncbi:hypothetical protein HW555_009455 [Spodoptera exigua]|uniref:Uncharacterized protein n=1 Tax=Spodoptera exigua TaxID=7107 RepID=A0A835GD04_SPOEX|nr:hypothetical protein HW555_009455 [Spodoptera exigua]
MLKIWRCGLWWISLRCRGVRRVIPLRLKGLLYTCIRVDSCDGCEASRGSRPAAGFVPSRRAARLLAADLLALAAAQGAPAAFLRARPDMLQPFLKRVNDKVTPPSILILWNIVSCLQLTGNLSF